MRRERTEPPKATAAASRAAGRRPAAGRGARPPPPRGGDVYFSVVNDSMITLSDSTMPVWSGGVLYAPHSVFDGTNSTGIGFGLNFSYNRDTGIASSSPPSRS